MQTQNEGVEYQQEYNDPTPQRNDMGTTGFVLALLSVVLTWVPILNIVLWALGLFFSILALGKANSQRGLALAGLIITLVEAIIFCILVVCSAILFSSLH